MKIVKSLDDSGLLLKGISEAIQNEVEVQKRGCLSVFLGILGAGLLGNMIVGKGFIRGSCGSKRSSIKDF